MNAKFCRTAKKTLIFLFFVVSIIVFGPCSKSAEAFSLEEPTITYEDFLAYDGIKVFINGRYVEFNDEIGYPYMENGAVMISLPAIATGFGAYTERDSVKWIDDPEDPYRVYSVFIVSKYDYGVQIKDQEMRRVQYVYQEKGKVSSKVPTVIEETIPLNTTAVKKGDITYVPLRPLFELFGLTVRWDGENKIVHIETPSPAEAFPLIDFKEAEIISICDLNTASYRTFIYDGQTVCADYISILKASNQYCVSLKDDIAYIFSYRYLADLNYLYGKVKQLKSTTTEDVPVLLYRASDDECSFFYTAFNFVPTQINLMGPHKSWTTSSSNPNPTRSNYYSVMECRINGLNTVMEEVHKIAERVKKETNNPKEQAIRVSKILYKEIKYEINTPSLGQGAYDALVAKKAVCGGFAHAFQLIMEELNIPSIHITGILRGRGSHAWNQVYVDGAWYIFDATGGRSMIPLDSKDYELPEASKVIDLDLNTGGSTSTTEPFDVETYENQKSLFIMTYRFN